MYTKANHIFSLSNLHAYDFVCSFMLAFGDLLVFLCFLVTIRIIAFFVFLVLELQSTWATFYLVPAPLEFDELGRIFKFRVRGDSSFFSAKIVDDVNDRGGWSFMRIGERSKQWLLNRSLSSQGENETERRFLVERHLIVDVAKGKPWIVGVKSTCICFLMFFCVWSRFFDSLVLFCYKSMQLKRYNTFISSKWKEYNFCYL